MKILILMPCSEAWTYHAMGIYNALPTDVKEKTFCMPTYMDYLVQTKISPDWIHAYYDCAVSVKALYQAAEMTGEHFVLIGNTLADLPFDAIFNFQDEQFDLPYEDKFIKKLDELVKDIPALKSYTAALHQADESKMALHNYVATADFITDYLDTEVDFDHIKEKYVGRLKFKQGGEEFNGH